MNMLDTKQARLVLEKFKEGKKGKYELQRYITGIDWDHMCQLYLLVEYCEMLEDVEFEGLTTTQITTQIEKYKDKIGVVIYPKYTVYEAFRVIMDRCSIDLPVWIRDSLDYKETIENFAMNYSWTVFNDDCGLVLEV